MVEYVAMKNGKHPGGRPRAIGETEVAILERLFRADATDEEACQEAKIDRSTLYRELKRNPEFCNKIRAAQRYPILLAKKNWIQGIMNGDLNASIQFLRHRQSDRYNTRLHLKSDRPQIPMEIYGMENHPFARKVSAKE